jgi:hypothetical protein
MGQLVRFRFLPIATLTVNLYSPQLGVDTWEYDIYADPKDKNFPPIVIPLDEIQCQISRGKLSHTNPPLWITTTMDRVRQSVPFIANGGLIRS